MAAVVVAGANGVVPVDDPQARSALPNPDKIELDALGWNPAAGAEDDPAPSKVAIPNGSAAPPTPNALLANGLVLLLAATGGPLSCCKDGIIYD